MPTRPLRRAAAALLVACFFARALGGQAAATGGSDLSVVVDGGWRFAAVSDRLIRIEYDEKQIFVDEPTDAFVRSPHTGTWQGEPSQDPMGKGWATVMTPEVVVRYLRAVPPAKNTVVVTSRQNNSYAWHWGDDPSVGNLGGTARTLDGEAETLDLNCSSRVSPTMENSEMHCTWGLVSRQGWAVVNQTGAPLWRDGWYAPSRNSIDVFVFFHGLDFAGALKDFVQAAGAPAVPPRYALGTIFTRWFNFDSDSVMSLIENFEGHSMPLDSWIFDMNWHLYGPWGSFTWNEESYPMLQELLDWIKSKGLSIGANTHDQSGIAEDEKTYKRMCTALGRNSCNGTLPFDLYNKSYAMAQEDIAWRALQTRGDKQGIDFAWIDYQQGEHDSFEHTQIPGINPTIVLNRLRSTDAERHGENLRPMILSRWGGLGSHKYPVGFSGDQSHTWKALAWLPSFTSTAANVAFGYWSHDTVGGHHQLARDHELSVRWFQNSAWSPVLRMHDKGDGTGGCATDESCARVVPWEIPSAFFSAIRSASWKRDELMPYIYTSAFSAASTGLALVRPMYYEDPSNEALYGLARQYLFGPDMIISPITTPSGDIQSSEQALGAVQWSIYAPQTGLGWVDDLNGDFASGKETQNVYGIMDVPRLVRQGAVIPMRPRMPGESNFARAMQPLHALEFRISPAEAFYTGGSVAGSGEAVDDDGLTTGYLHGEYTVTRCSYSFHGRIFRVNLSRMGDFANRPSTVTVRLSFPQLPPMSVSTSSVGGLSASVAYSHEIIGPVVTLGNVDFTSELSVELQIDDAYSVQALSGFVGLLGRVRRTRYVKDALDAANVPYGTGRAKLTSHVLAAAHMGPAFATGLPQLWQDAVGQVAELVKHDPTLQKDARRSKFISEMLQLNDGQGHAQWRNSFFV